VLGDEPFDHMGERFLEGPDHRDGFLRKRQKELWRIRYTNRMHHRGSNLAHHRICEQNGDRADYDLGLSSTVANCVFSRRAAICACFHHLCGCDRIGPERPDLGPLTVYVLYSPNDGGSDSTSLPIDNGNTDQAAILLKGVRASGFASRPEFIAIVG